MITNREIKSTALLEEALAEVVDSARENGVSDGAVAAALRDHAAAVETAGGGDSGSAVSDPSGADGEPSE